MSFCRRLDCQNLLSAMINRQYVSRNFTGSLHGENLSEVRSTTQQSAEMNPLCAKCRGACCEIMILNFSRFMDADDFRWFSLHGRRIGGEIILDMRCSKLTDEGLCEIYPDRPKLCKVIQPGSSECLKVAKIQGRKL